MGADRYYERLYRARVIWSTIMVVVWLVYFCNANGTTSDLIDVTVFLGGAWFLGFPRNGAKSAARRAARARDFNEAAEREARR